MLRERVITLSAIALSVAVVFASHFIFSPDTVTVTGSVGSYSDFDIKLLSKIHELEDLSDFAERLQADGMYEASFQLLDKASDLDCRGWSLYLVSMLETDREELYRSAKAYLAMNGLEHFPC